MPWKVEHRGDQWCVVKESDGSTEACHDNEADAKAQVAALYASEGDKAAPPPPPPDEQQADPNAAPALDDQTPPETATVEVPSSIRKLVLNIQAAATDAQEAVVKTLLRRKEDEATGFKVAGNHWMAVWSNNFKDRDGEIFPESAIDAYVSRVDSGIVKLPELWVWHAGKQTAIGASDWVGRHGHFVMASGQFYGGAQAQAAKAYYTKHAKDTGISHGFTYPSDTFDGKHYQQFNTFEVSLLPRGSEANWFTSLEGMKDMALDERKVKYLKEVFGEEHATRILADWDARGKALEELNVEFKDFVAPADDTSTTSKAAADKANQSFTELVPDLMEGSAEAVTAALEAVKLVKAQNDAIAALRREVAETKALVAQRPRASQSTETVVETSHLSPELQKTLKQQNTVKDDFWGTEVVKP